VEKIRLINWFTDVLNAISFTIFQGAVTDNPAVVVNIRKYRSDAIIFLKSVDLMLVPLPKATPLIFIFGFTT
jgi:hypothetical protein